MYSTKYQVTQAQLLQAQQERVMILSELEQVRQTQLQLQFQLDQILSLLQPLQGLQLFDPAILRSQLQEIQTQIMQAQEERWQELTLELTPLQSQLSNCKTLLQSGLAEPKFLQATILEVSHFEPSSELDEPISTQSLDYQKLRDLLAAGKWEEADQETKLMMLKVAKIEQKAKFESEHFHNLSCEYLRGIDKLWLKYSKGHFGFTVQKRIFEKTGGTPGIEDYKAYCRFGEEVGWLVKNHWLCERNLQFSLNAPAGHLPIAPFLPLIRGIRSKKLYFCDFLSQLETCQQ